MSVPEAVVLLLERMELSRGFSNLTPAYSQHGATLLPPNSIIQMIVKDREKENEGTSKPSSGDQITTRSSQVLWNDTFQPQPLNPTSESEESKDPKPRYKSLKGQYFPTEEDDEVERQEIKR